MSTIEVHRRLKRMDYRPRVGYDGRVVAGSGSKQHLASEAWRPLARFVLDRSEGRTMSDLAEAWGCDASNATFIVDRLEERELAERRTVETDRRVKLVILTAPGAAVRGRVLQRFFEPPPELLELSREDLEALREAAARLPVAEGGVGRAVARPA
jgi:DNA-binding MarR family transcriptional regulator